jgi:hypothetical protein
VGRDTEIPAINEKLMSALRKPREDDVDVMRGLHAGRITLQVESGGGGISEASVKVTRRDRREAQGRGCVPKRVDW